MTVGTVTHCRCSRRPSMRRAKHANELPACGLLWPQSNPISSLRVFDTGTRAPGMAEKLVFDLVGGVSQQRRDTKPIEITQAFSKSLDHPG